MSTRGKKTGLVFQEGVMIPQTETPVLSITNVGSFQEIASAVNFLRSGCPAVQICIPAHWPNKSITETRGLIRGELDLLSFTGEMFGMSWPESDDRGRVLIIRRTVASKEVETAFGNLRPNDWFVQEHGGIEYRVAQDHNECVAVAWTGSINGRIVRFAEHDPVIKLIE